MATTDAKQHLETQVLYGPFVPPADKVDKDIAEMSLSDFYPKRFALNYEPPMISKSSKYISNHYHFYFLYVSLFFLGYFFAKMADFNFHICHIFGQV